VRRPLVIFLLLAATTSPTGCGDSQSITGGEMNDDQITIEDGYGIVFKVIRTTGIAEVRFGSQVVFSSGEADTELRFFAVDTDARVVHFECAGDNSAADFEVRLAPRGQEGTFLTRFHVTPNNGATVRVRRAAEAGQ